MAYEFWKPSDYTPSGVPYSAELELSYGTSPFTDADNDLLPTADPDYIAIGSPPTMSLDIRYKTQEAKHCGHT